MSERFRQPFTCPGPRQFMVGRTEHGRFITFYPCGIKSWNANDIENLFCGRCQRFVDDAQHVHPYEQNLRSGADDDAAANGAQPQSTGPKERRRTG